MKTKLTLLKSLILTVCCALISTAGFAQASMEVRVWNDAQTSPTEYEFDITLVNLSTTDTLELSGHQYGINYNTAIKNGGTLTAAWVSGTSEIVSGQLQTTINTASNPSQMRISSLPLVGAGNGTKIAPGGSKRVGRLRMTNSVPFGLAKPNIVFSTVASTSSTRTTHGWYNGTTNTNFCSPSLSTTCSGTATWTYLQSNPTLTPNNCSTPVGSGIVTDVSCAGGSNGAIDLTVTTGGPAPFSYTWSNGATSEDISGLSAGNYSVIISPAGGICLDTVSFTVNDGAPLTSNTTVASACDTYTWSVDGQTYTASGTYSSVSGCNTEILSLTITPSTSNTTTISACDSYEWSVNGQTYTASGSYTSVTGCNTEILELTITPSTSNTTTASACDSYVWSVTGATFTSSGTYSSVNGCHTELLELTITPSTSNTTTTSSCDSYVWSVNGSTYSASGSYTSVSGCHTEILELTIIQSTTNTQTEAACISYTWAQNGETYTQTGIYTAVAGCATYILDLNVTQGLSAPGPIAGNLSACVPGVAGSTTFSVPAMSGALSYTWTAPAGFTISAGQGTNTITVSWTGTAAQAGITGDLCVLATSACGNSPSTCEAIDYQITKPVTPPSISGSSKLCPGETATFSISPVARASSYSWTVPTGMTITSGQGTNIINVSVSAGYAGGSVSVSASNFCGTSPVRSRTISTNPPATPGAISGISTGLCNASGAAFSVTAIAGATSYNWTVSTGTISSGQGSNSITVDFGTFTTGSITVQAVNGCGTSSLRSLGLRGAPSQPGVISGATAVCAPSSQSYSVATVSGASNYNWTRTFAGTISSGQGTKNVLVSWNQVASNQSVAVSASNSCGTSAVRGLSGIQVTSCARSFDNEGAFTLTAFPNPASDRVTIVFNAPKDGDYRLSIVDLSGRLMFAQEIDILSGVSQMDFDLGGYAAGMYLVSLENGQEIQNIRLVVE
jgi:hypothetical protein